MCFYLCNNNTNQTKQKTLQKLVKISKSILKIVFKFFVCPPLESFKIFILFGMFSINFLQSFVIFSQWNNIWINSSISSFSMQLAVNKFHFSQLSTSFQSDSYP